MQRTLYWSAIAPAILLLATLALPGLALAHERRAIGGGKYVAVVGWDTEPAYQDQLNAATIRIMRADTSQPVEGLEKSLTLQIAFGGGQPREFPLRAVFQQPGAYAADIQPTKAGSYVWTLSGTIEGTPINETFESGPGRFDDVESGTAVQFPSPAADPAAAIADAQAARAEAASARTLGIAGIVIGGLGLLAAIAAFATRRPAATGGAAARAGGESRP